MTLFSFSFYASSLRHSMISIKFHRVFSLEFTMKSEISINYVYSILLSLLAA